ncbi:MAG: serine hydrolase domain-containing protein [Acidobacteriaceae bacterium]
MKPLADITIPASAADGPSRFAAARRVLDQAIADRAFPGASYGVLYQGQILALDAVGRFTYEADSTPVTPSTIYDLASLTKVLATTAAAMLLYERGVLKLDARLGDILPGFVVGMRRGSGRERLTLRMLLAHSSGLPAYIPFFQQHPTPQGLLRAVLHTPLEVRAGSRAEYSDLGFILLGKALEVISGDYLARFCERNIFAPLGLNSLRFCPPPAWQPSIPPTENDTTFRHRIIQGEVQDENCFVLGGAAGHAGLFGRAADVLRFAQLMLRNPASESSPQPLFREETIRLFTTRQDKPEGTTRALGWDTPSNPSSSGKHFGPRSFGHLGYSGTSLWIDPDRNLAVVLLTNRTWPDRSSKAIQTVRPAFHDAIVESL